MYLILFNQIHDSSKRGKLDEVMSGGGPKIDSSQRMQMMQLGVNFIEFGT